MKAVELRKLTYKELGEHLSESKAELFNLRFQLVTNQLDNHTRIRDVKRDIARLKTVMHQQEIAAYEQSIQEDA